MRGGFGCGLRLLVWVAGPLLSTILLAGCEVDPPTIGTLSIPGLAVDKCELGSNYELELDFLGFNDCEDMLFVRVQGGGRPLSESDGAQIQIYGFTALKQELEQEGGGGVIVDVPSESARGSIILNKSCSDAFPSLEWTNGRLQLQTADVEHEGKLRFQATFDILDARTSQVVSKGAKMEVEGKFLLNSPHRDFVYCP